MGEKPRIPNIPDSSHCVVSIDGDGPSEIESSGTETTPTAPMGPIQTPKKRKGFPKLNDPIFKNPDIHKPPIEIIQDKGYPCEFHEVVSRDGYIISLFRIPFGKIGSPKGEPQTDPLSHNSSNPLRPAALFAHGILNHGGNWIMNSPEIALPYRLADKGYDVWMLNARGCEYSKKHVELETKSRKFWKFSFEEMAKNDLPLVLNYILTTSRQDSLVYIGHSMGCSTLFAACSLDPEVSKKIKLMIAFAPAVYLNRARSLFVKFASKVPGLMTLVSGLYYGEFCLRSTLQMTKLAPWVWCWRRRLIPDASWFFIKISNLINGPDPDQINWPILPVLMAQCPSPTSVKTYSHFLQMCRTGLFRQYDYGTRRNYRMYGKPEPPAFDLGQSTFPVAIFCAENDYCVHPKDAEQLAAHLPNVVTCHTVEWPKFNHFDFVTAKDADKLVYDHVVKIMDKFSGNEKLLDS